MSEVNWRLGHLDHLETPWANAGGVVKRIEDVEGMAMTGVGWIEAGSYTLDEKFGNDRDPESGEYIIDEDTGQPITVWHYNPVTGEMDNSLGMPNKGMDEVDDEIPEMVKIAHSAKIPKKLVVNVAPVSDNPLGETKELVTRAFEAGADGVILNGGCPNVITQDGSRHEILSSNPQAWGRVLFGLRPIAERFKPVYVRITPPRSYDSLKTILRITEASRSTSAVFLPNSFNRPIPVVDGKKVLGVRGETAGMTGPATAERTIRLAIWAKQILNGSGIDLVRSGGIADWEAGGVDAAQELKRTLSIGALGAGSTFYYQAGESWADATDRLLRRLISD